MTEPKGPKRRLFTRRRFLVAGGSLIATGGLGFGGYVFYGHHQRFGRSALEVIPDHRVDLPAVIPRMVVARGGDPAINVRAAIERLGGMGNLLAPDDTVLIKPNIGWQRPPEHAANTHPDVVAEIVRLCREAGPNASSSPTVRSVNRGPPSSGAASAKPRRRRAPRSSSPRTAATAP